MKNDLLFEKFEIQKLNLKETANLFGGANTCHSWKTEHGTSGYDDQTSSDCEDYTITAEYSDSPDYVC